MTDIQFLEDFYRVVWSDGNVGSIDRFFHEDVRSDGFGPEFALDVQDFITLVQAVRAMVEAITFTIQHSVSQGEWLAAMVEMSCRSRSTGAPVRVGAQIMVRLRDGRIIEAHNHFDVLAFFQQIGRVPPDLTARLLAGDSAL